MPVHTLVEYAKTVSDLKQQAVIELFPEESDILRVLPFKSAPGGRYGYFREGALPTNMAFRGINEVPTDGYGLVNDFTEMCFPMAGQINVDRVLLDRYGMERRSTEERMQIKAKAHLWAQTFINGDNATNPRGWTGMRQRLRTVGSGAASVDGSNIESRVFANSQTSGGAALSLSQLDIAISLVAGATHLLMPRQLKFRFPAAVRDAGVGGIYTNDIEDAGRRVERYAGLEILTGYDVSRHGYLLNFDEVAFGGGAAVTGSIYVMAIGEQGVCGIETKPMEVTDMGMINNGVHYRTDVHHDNGICIESPYAALRMTSITNAAIVK
jgi:hypothetical protein